MGGVTVFGASFSHFLNVYEVVTFGVNSDGFSRKFFATCVAVNYVIVASVCCAGGIYVVFGNCIARSVLAYHVRGSFLIINGVISIFYLVGVITVIDVASGVEFYEFTAGNNKFTSVIGFCFVNIENVPSTKVIFLSLKVTTFDVDDTVGFAEDNVTKGSRVVVTTLDSKCRVDTAGNNGICACDVSSAAYNVTFANNCDIRAIMNVENLNNAGGFPVCLQCFFVQVDCNSSSNNLNSSREVDVSYQLNAVACIENSLEVGFVGDFNDCAYVINGLLNVYIIANTASVNKAKLFINNLVFFG